MAEIARNLLKRECSYCKYVNLDDFSQNASSDEIVGLIKGINIKT